jgi:hypothetical protein
VSSEEAAVQDQRRAIEARALTDNPAFQSALDRVERDYVEAWKHSADAAHREALWHRLKALDDLRQDLTAAISGGAVAAHNARLRHTRR